MTFRYKFYSGFFIAAVSGSLVLSAVSCAPVPPKPDSGLPKVSVPQPITNANEAKIASLSFLPLNQSAISGLLWWNLSDKYKLDWNTVFLLRNKLPELTAPAYPSMENLSQLREGKFLFNEKQSHDFAVVEPSKVKENSEYQPISIFNWSDWKQTVAAVFVLFILILLMSVVWRGFSFVNLYFSLWKRRKREELFGKVLLGKSSLVPPVSLFLFSRHGGSELLHQISAAEKLDYEEAELIVFRDICCKDEDSILLKDFRLRYRSPLYFSDLDFEEPFEILEVQGGRRILLVYSKNHRLKTAFVLFLKLARYPLTGLLHENTRLNSQALSKLVYRWLLEGEKQACVFGFLEESGHQPVSSLLRALTREGMFLNVLSGNSLETWIEGDSLFCLIPKYIAILYADQTNGKLNEPFLWTDVSSFEIVGTNIKKEKQFLHDLAQLIHFSFNAFAHIKYSFMTGMSMSNMKLFFDRLSCLTALVLWPLILIGYFGLLGLGLTQVQYFGLPVLFLAGTELILMGWVSLIWILFAENKIQLVLPLNPVIQMREKPEMSV